MGCPVVSVIIPNYNRTEELSRSIQSVLCQTYAQFEIIVVDDGSTIDPGPCIAHLADARIVLCRLDRNRGAAAARNHGAMVAKGKYVAFLDSDDEWLPGFLQRRVDLIQERGADAIYGGTRKYLDNKLIDLPPVHQVETGQSMINYVLSGALRASTSTLLLKKQVFCAVQYNPEFHVHEDLVLMIELHKKYTILCDQHADTICHSSAESLSSEIGDSGLKLLRRYGSELESKWLFFYIARKSKHALTNNENRVAKAYVDLLEQRYAGFSTFYKLNFLALKYFNSLYLNSVDCLVRVLYLLRRLKSRMSEPELDRRNCL